MSPLSDVASRLSERHRRLEHGVRDDGREGAAPHAREDLRLQKRGEDVLRLQLGVEAGLKAQVKDRARDLSPLSHPRASAQS